MKKLLLLFILQNSLIYTVNYFDAGITYTGGFGIQGSISNKIIADHGDEYTYDWQAAADYKRYIWDGVRFGQDSGGNLSLDDNISYTSSHLEKHWQNILFDETTNHSRRAVELNSESIFNGNRVKTLGTQNLILIDTDFDISAANLFFSDPTKNSLTLKNSSLSAKTGKLIANFSSTFDIISESGNNRLTSINDPISTKINLDVKAGSELDFYNSGSVSFGNKDPIVLGDLVTGVVDNGTLKLTYSNLKFISNPDEFIFKNNSTLELFGFNTKLELTNSTFIESEILLRPNTHFKGYGMKLENSDIYVDTGSTIQLNGLIVKGTSNINGYSTSTTNLKASILELEPSTILTTKGIHKIETNLIKMNGTGSVLNIENRNFIVNDGFFIDDGTINVKKGSSFTLGDNYINTNMKLKLNIDLGAEFVIDHTGGFILNNSTGVDNDFSTLTNNGDISTFGTLLGSGTILGDGTLYLKKGSSINPEYFTSKTNTINNLIFIGNLKIENKLIFEDSTYYANLDFDTNDNVLSDKIFYVDKDIDISKGLVVETLYNGTLDRSAMDFHDKKFTVVQSDTASSAGDIIGDYSNISVVDSPNLPALLDFRISDEQTNGKKDITLIGEVQGVHTLANHSKIGKNSNAKQVVNILPPTTPGTNPILSLGAQKLQDALLTMTNAQVEQNLNALHAEPYSSHLTVGLEQNDLFLNMIMDRSIPKGKAYIGKIEEINLQNNMWFDIGYKEGKVSSEDELGNFKYSLTNVILGGDLYKKDQLILGAYGGYGKHKMREHDMVTQDFETDSYHLGGYGSYIYKDLIFTGVLGYAYGNNQSERNITVGTESGTSKDRFDTHSIYTGIRGAYPIEIAPKIILTPNAGLSYSYLYQEEVVESGFDMADLKVDSTSADSFISSIGLNLTYDGVINSTSIRPMTFVKYERDWSAAKDSTHDVNAGFVHTPDSMTTFTGQNRGKNLILVGIGVEVEVTPTFLVGVELSYSDDTNGEETGVGFNFEYLW